LPPIPCQSEYCRLWIGPSILQTAPDPVWLNKEVVTKWHHVYLGIIKDLLSVKDQHLL
jgi:hypothetical protein